MVRRSLWIYPVISKEIHSKDIWNQFTSIITLIEQMQYLNNKLFQAMMTKARKDLFNIDNVTIVNSKIVVTILILNLDKQDVIVQQNAIWHTINRIQIKRFAKVHNRNIIIFSTEYLRTKKDGSQIVDNTNLLNVQDGKETCIGPGILYYCKIMLVCLLTNMNTPLGIVNGIGKTEALVRFSRQAQGCLGLLEREYRPFDVLGPYSVSITLRSVSIPTYNH